MTPFTAGLILGLAIGALAACTYVGFVEVWHIARNATRWLADHVGPPPGPRPPAPTQTHVRRLPDPPHPRLFDQETP